MYITNYNFYVYVLCMYFKMVFKKHCNTHRDDDLADEDAEKARLLGDSDYKDQRMIATPTRRGKTTTTTNNINNSNSRLNKSNGKGQQDSFVFSKFSTYGVMQLLDSIKVKSKSNRI